MTSLPAFVRYYPILSFGVPWWSKDWSGSRILAGKSALGRPWECSRGLGASTKLLRSLLTPVLGYVYQFGDWFMTMKYRALLSTPSVLFQSYSEVASGLLTNCRSTSYCSTSLNA